MIQTEHEAPIRVRGLTKRYGQRSVLRGLDLDVAAGETYALLGPNGAGKSTAIEILEGTRWPDTGEVRVLGREPLSAPRSWKAGFGTVAQTTGEYGPYSPRELISYFSRLYAQPRGVDEVLELVGLTDQAQARAAQLSGGQQRRLDVALGIVGRPRLLFLDEPTTGFDPAARRQFWDMLEGLSSEGVSILLTTHYLDEAARLADRVGVLSGGRIVAEGPPAELGGVEARTPVVSWRDASGERREERTHLPAAVAARLREATLAAGDSTGEPAELEIKRPGLEDIYLELIRSETEDAQRAEHAKPTEHVESGTEATR